MFGEAVMLASRIAWLKPIDLNKLDLLIEQGPLADRRDSVASAGVGTA